MSLWDCIQRAIDAGQMSRRRGAAAQSYFEERRSAHASLGAGADAAAAEDVWVKLRQDHLRRRRGNLLQVKKGMELIDKVTRFRDAQGNSNAAQALLELISWQQHARFESVESITEALRGSYRRQIAGFLKQHAPNIIGTTRNRARLPDIVRALYGEQSTAQARAMADAVRRTLEMARRDFNAAGGSIGKLEDYDVPHSWNAAKLRDVGAERWMADQADRLDWDRMIDLETDLPFTHSTLERRHQFLRQIYDSITSDGWSKREPAGVQLGRSTAKARSDPRVLHYRSADAWLEMNDAYGVSDVFSTVIAHLDNMARDTAMMRILGPNPRAGLELARQTATKLAHERPWKPSTGLTVGRGYKTAVEEVQGAGNHARRMLDVHTGASNRAEMDTVASFFSGARHFLISAQLGGAMLSAVTDHGFMYRASKHVGLNFSNVIGRHVKLIASSGARDMAIRSSVIADTLANTGVAQARFMGDVQAPEIAQRVSEFTMRASFLTRWTEMARGAFRLEFYGMLAENAARSWDDLDQPLRDLVLDARGITPAEWDIIRSTELYRDQHEPEATFLIPDDIRHRTDIDGDQAVDIALKLEAAIREQVEFAVPSASLRGRANVEALGNSAFMRELAKTGLMYKSFAMSLMYNQLGRISFARINGSRASAGLGFALITTVAGGISLQMKDLAAGRDPRPMDTPAFVYAAAIQGGGLGILGDFAYAAENRFGGGLEQTVAGPVVGLVDDTAGLIGNGVKALMSDDPRHSDQAGRAMVRYLNRYTPGQNLWYANLAIDRMFWDQLQELVDSEAQKDWDRRANRRARDFGQELYWPQGDPLPLAPPDFSNTIGGAQ
ncbi:MAG: hypothetical protein AAFU34_15530 [Pseudomonadota bacterium]